MARAVYAVFYSLGGNLFSLILDLIYSTGFQDISMNIPIWLSTSNRALQPSFYLPMLLSNFFCVGFFLLSVYPVILNIIMKFSIYLIPTFTLPLPFLLTFPLPSFTATLQFQRLYAVSIDTLKFLLFLHPSTFSSFIHTSNSNFVH